MRRMAFAGMAAAMALAGCGDPLDDMARLSDVEMPPETQVASLVPAPSETAGAPGFLARILGGNAPGGDPEAATGDVPRVEPGTIPPFGAVAAVCNLPESALGTQVATASGYTLWDGDPGNPAPHAHYVTGMDDGCARVFAAAFAVFGDVATHEAISQLSGDHRAHAATDPAFDAIRSEICRTPPGAPCGSRMEALAARTVFVSVYESFDESPVWTEILLHDGRVAASGAAGG